MEINVKELIKTEFAIKAEKGEILHKELEKGIKKNEEIVLDFSGIEASTTRFFNVSIGKLYGEFSEETIDNIKINNANEVVANQIEVSKNGSKIFYSSKWLWFKNN